MVKVDFNGESLRFIHCGLSHGTNFACHASRETLTNVDSNKYDLHGFVLRNSCVKCYVAFLKGYKRYTNITEHCQLMEDRYAMFIRYFLETKFTDMTHFARTRHINKCTNSSKLVLPKWTRLPTGSCFQSSFAPTVGLADSVSSSLLASFWCGTTYGPPTKTTEITSYSNTPNCNWHFV